MFLFASFSQVAIFLAVFVVPLGLMNICNLIIPTIGLNTPIALVVMYKPYRDFVIKKLLRRGEKEKTPNTKSAVVF
ncbi:hypothetical protein B9Z55_028270 [Caenorhabditis nigoni]|nr:hypothetical protein B9Z55_028270 [Caenorhabditis nigoni]